MAEIDAHEFAEWMAYAYLEPFGPEREDARAGEVAAVIANVNRDPKSNPEPWTPADFFPNLAVEAVRSGQEPVPLDDSLLESKLIAWAKSMGATRG